MRTQRDRHEMCVHSGKMARGHSKKMISASQGEKRRRNQFYLHLNLELPASRTVRKYISVMLTTCLWQFVMVGSPCKLIQKIKEFAQGHIRISGQSSESFRTVIFPYNHKTVLHMYIDNKGFPQTLGRSFRQCPVKAQKPSSGDSNQKQNA